MLQSLKELCGSSLGTSEGEIGQVKDFYFDDVRWAVRYVVVNTGTWLAGREVLISPHAFGNVYHDIDCLLVGLTKKQIQDSPPIESHKPVSRQYEEAYYRYYGWPAYWNGAEMWGGSGFPVVPPPPVRPAIEEGPGGESSNSEDTHLRSTSVVTGYRIQCGDAVIGHVTDFIIEDKSWAVREVVVKTGHWFFGKEIMISPKDIVRISFEDSTVFVKVTREAILESTEDGKPDASYDEAETLSDSTA